MKNFTLISLFTAILIFLGGCGTSRPSKFYTLSSMPVPAEKAQLNDNQNRIAVGIDLDDFPAYLNKPQMVIRVNPNELKLDEFNRWAETLKYSFPKVIVNNLISILPAEKFIVYLNKGILSSDYQVVLNLIQFDGTPGGKVSLIVQWGLFDTKNEKLILTKVSNINVDTKNDCFEALVAAQSKALEILSREISLAVEKVKK